MMNKFSGVHDPDYDVVATKIQDLLQAIRDGDAYARVQKNCYGKENLRIERLSGDFLDMGSCYINLIIQQHSSAGKDILDGSQTSPFLLDGRLDLDMSNKETMVDLASIFDPRAQPDGSTLIPRRIMIRGRAGVGKTTLCKKIVHDFVHGSSHKQSGATIDKWRTLFRRILWVPLRRLKDSGYSDYNLGGLLFHIYFGTDENGRRLARELWDSIRSETPGSLGALFLLDGLDEVSDLLDPESGQSIHRLLKELLLQPNVIVTSRPHAASPSGGAGMKNVDLELETTGFFSEQVDKYLAMSLSKDSQESSTQLNGAKDFLRTHPRMEGLVRIPIQLDAFCFIWSERSHGDDIGKLHTMTGVYQAIELRLWRKDILRLRKTDTMGVPLRRSDLSNASLSNIEVLARDEITFLEGLAFRGLIVENVEFDWEDIHTAVRHYAPVLLPDQTLPCLSFLRTPDRSLALKDQVFHFLHLTYQEYFAARYFARMWTSHGSAQPMIFGGKATDTIRPFDFVRQHKYNPRYDVFWRFVFGLVDSRNQTSLTKLIDVIEEEPVDIVGLKHNQLALYCLSEISSEQTRRHQLESRLSEWLRYDSQHDWLLLEEPDVPEHVVCKLLHDLSCWDDLGELENFLNALPPMHSPCHQAQAATDVHNLLEIGDDRFKKTALACLSRNDRLPQPISEDLINRLLHSSQNGGPWSWVDFRNFLRQQTSLKIPPSVSEDIEAALSRTEDPSDQVTIATILDRNSHVPEYTMAAAESPDPKLRECALDHLRMRGGSLPDVCFDRLTALLDDTHTTPTTRSWIFDTLKFMSVPPEANLMPVVRVLQDGVEPWQSTRVAAAKFLRRQPSLTSEILLELAMTLRGCHEHARYNTEIVIAMKILVHHLKLDETSSQIRDEDWLGPRGAYRLIRDSAATALQSNPSLPRRTREILECIALVDLYDQYGSVDILLRQSARSSTLDRNAILALSGLLTLPEGTIATIAEHLWDDDEDMVKASIQALDERPGLTPAVLTDLAKQSGHRNKDIARAALAALRHVPCLPQSVHEIIMRSLSNSDDSTRSLALEVMAHEPNLPSAILAAVIHRLSMVTESWQVRQAALEVFTKQSRPSNEVLMAISKSLGDDHVDIAYSAEYFLCGQKTLPEMIVMFLIHFVVGDERSEVRNAAINVLLHQTEPSEAVITTVEEALLHMCYFYRPLDPSFLSFFFHFCRRGQPGTDSTTVKIVENFLNDTTMEVEDIEDVLEEVLDKYHPQILGTRLVGQLYRYFAQPYTEMVFSWTIDGRTSRIVSPEGKTYAGEIESEAVLQSFWEQIHSTRKELKVPSVLLDVED